MGSSTQGRRWRWALSGAAILVLANLVLAMAVGGAEWTDSAVYGSPGAALLGIALGYVAAVLRDRRDR